MSKNITCPHCKKNFKYTVKSNYNPEYKINTHLVKQTLKKLKMTQTELAEIIDRERETLNRIINGKESLTEKVLYKISEALNLDIDDVGIYIGRQKIIEEK